MRDLRDDLRQRAAMIEEQVQSAQAQFEQYLEQLKRDHDNRLQDLRAELEAVKVLLNIEQRRHGGAPAPVSAVPVQAAPAQAQRAKPQQPLADFLIRKLGELGPMPKEELEQMAVKEGYFSDGDAERGVQAVLAYVVKSGHVRQLPNGDFAEVIRLRRAM
ncbi:MAG TPA: hypothetical protein VNJ31_01355 [Methyloceanibacter sp.]|nr:hypothetical protein [Methyloceanibacter sp.]